MSRIIKFRAWQTVTKRMFTNIEKGTGDTYNPNPPFADYLENGHMIVMQFTGLLDIHDLEIYEGDIIGIEGATAKVVFWERPPAFGLDFSHNEDAWCEDWNLTDDSGRMEIIGNIHENEELLREPA